jgi:hypothetical protein
VGIRRKDPGDKEGIQAVGTGFDFVAKWGAAFPHCARDKAASLHGGAEARPCTNRILLRVSGDEELEGARDDAKFDREAREGLAVDLRVDGICGERFAEDGFRFEEFDAWGAAKLVEPERRQVAEIAETALRGECQDFEAVLEEIGFSGDLERAAVILRAADDDQRSVAFAAAADDPEMPEFVAKDLAEACPPIRENADARFQPKIDGVDDCAVRAGPSDAEKIFFLFRLLERSCQAESDFFDCAVNQFLRSFGNVPREIEFLGEDVGRAAGEKRERNALAVSMGGEAVDDFVERAVAAAGDDEAAILRGGARGDFGGMAGSGRFGEVSVNAACGKDVARLIEQTATRAATVSGFGVVDQQGVL